MTREKFQILGSDYLDTLRKYVDDSQIPVELGGSHAGFKWNWPYPEESYCTPQHIREYAEYLKGDGKRDLKSQNEISEDVAVFSSSSIMLDGGVIQEDIALVSTRTPADPSEASSSELFVSSTTVYISP